MSETKSYRYSVVRQEIDRIELPSTSMLRIWARLGMSSLFMPLLWHGYLTIASIYFNSKVALVAIGTLSGSARRYRRQRIKRQEVSLRE